MGKIWQTNEGTNRNVYCFYCKITFLLLESTILIWISCLHWILLKLLQSTNLYKNGHCWQDTWQNGMPNVPKQRHESFMIKQLHNIFIFQLMEFSTKSSNYSILINFTVKDVPGWQFLTMKAVETLCIVCLPPDKHISWKKYLGNRPSKKSHFIRVLSSHLHFYGYFKKISFQNSSLGSTLSALLIWLKRYCIIDLTL